MTRAASALRSAEPPSWLKAYRDLPRSHGFEPMRVEGRLPEELNGTLVRVGPVIFGWLLVQTYDATSDRTYVAVLDAKAPEAGPVGRAWLEHAFPLTFHGTWVTAR